MDSTISCAHCEQEVDATENACPACGHLHEGTRQCARHPEREANGVCVICADAVCADCNDDSTHHSCPEHRAVPVIEGWAQIYTTSDTVEAELIKENLIAEGVDAEVLSQKDRSFNFELGDMSPVRILVPAFAYREGMQVLAGHKDFRGEVVFACPSCGEAFDTGDTICSSCGTPLPTPAG